MIIVCIMIIVNKTALTLFFYKTFIRETQCVFHAYFCNWLDEPHICFYFSCL